MAGPDEITGNAVRNVAARRRAANEFPGVAATEDVEAYPRQYDNGHEPELRGCGRNAKAPVGAWIGQ